MTPYEQLSAHGWHMHPLEGSKWGVSPVRSFLNGLSKGHIGRLAGNGISLPVVWSVWLYMLANIVPRERPAVSRREGSLACDKEDDEDDAFEDWEDF